jgi:hypothetical protein
MMGFAKLFNPSVARVSNATPGAFAASRLSLRYPGDLFEKLGDCRGALVIAVAIDLNSICFRVAAPVGGRRFARTLPTLASMVMRGHPANATFPA